MNPSGTKIRLQQDFGIDMVDRLRMGELHAVYQYHNTVLRMLIYFESHLFASKSVQRLDIHVL